MAVPGKDQEEREDEQSPESDPWHNRTPVVVGASVAGIVVIGLLIVVGTFVARQFNQPEQAPLNFVEPSFSSSVTHSSSTPTTIAMITSTSPPVTTDIDSPSFTTGSSSSGTSGTSGADTTNTTHTAWTKPYTPPSGSGSTPTTTQRGPRFNVTRTLNP
ncbi:MAG: hypothetical protein NVSMB60_03540 [Mycobacterium sp.]